MQQQQELQKKAASAVEVSILLMCGIVSAVAEAGELGCPAGVLYAGLLELPGMSLDRFNLLMETLVTCKFLTKSANFYFATEHGKDFVTNNQHLWKDTQ